MIETYRNLVIGGLYKIKDCFLLVLGGLYKIKDCFLLVLGPSEEYPKDRVYCIESWKTQEGIRVELGHVLITTILRHYKLVSTEE